jgi:predicted ATPase/serine phosphatase RsbU (regulator of sigma subunit)
VGKLLSKTAEERYQSARGIRADLEHCLRSLRERGNIPAFPLAADDASGRLQMVQKLFGRESQAAALLEAFDAACAGRAGLLMVSGDAGIGKSALVHEVQKPIVRQRGIFVSGKFDQFRDDVPYAPLTHALRELIDHILASPGPELEQWASRLKRALGVNGGVLAALVPEIELIIGEQAPVQELPPKESQQRFAAVFRNFAREVSTGDHPVVLFLDDLQWADQASVDLLQQVLSDKQLCHFLLIGAFRGEDGAAAHRLRTMSEAVAASGAEVRKVSLPPLDAAAVTRLIAETLGLPEEASRPLAELVAAKTAGNPFFVNEFVRSLHHEGLLRFEGDLPRWTWDMDLIRQQGITDNVVAMMSANIQRLPPRTQECLQYAACLGNRFGLDPLARVRHVTAAQAAEDLWPAVRDGFVLPLGDAYQYFDGSGEVFEGIPAHDNDGASPVAFRFAHDRVQQAAYALIPGGTAGTIHYAIGRSQLDDPVNADRPETLFSAASHLNLGRECLVDTGERHELIRLNLRAGRRAKASAAFPQAHRYFAAGHELSVPADIPDLYGVVRDLLMERGECEYLTGAFPDAEETFDGALALARTPAEKGRIYGLKIELYIHRSRLEKALETGVTALRVLGAPIPVKPTKLTVLAEMARVRWNLGRRRIEDLDALPDMLEDEPRVAMSILMSLFGIAYSLSQEFSGLVISRMMNLTLRYGNADVSAYAYALYGLLLSAGFRMYPTGRRLATLSLRLSVRFDNRLLRGRCNFVFGCLHNHWSAPAATNREYLHEAYTLAMQSGDLLYASYALSQETIVDMFTGLPLPTVSGNAATHLGFVRDIHHGDIALYFEAARHWCAGLQTDRPGPAAESESSDYFRRLEESGYVPPKMFHRFTAVQQLYLTGDHTGANRLAEESAGYEHALIGQIVEAEYVYYRCLAGLALAAVSTGSERRGLLKRVAAGERRMTRWASLAPGNFAHKRDLVAAERARVEGHVVRAMRFYDAAIVGARAAGFVQDEGVANQRSGEFHLAEGRESIAAKYLSDARACFASWGADALVAQLERQHPDILPPVPAVRSTMHSTATRTTRTGTETLDLLSILKASQALSGEIVLSRLLERMMTIVLENAGAQRGVLIVEKGGRLVIEAEGLVGGSPEVILRTVALEGGEHLAESVVRYVARLREHLVLEDASAAGQFTDDPYVVRAGARSILCMPIEHQGKLSGILYLENSLAPGVFTPSRIEVLRLLSSQIAVSMENARLYAQEKELARMQEEVRLAAKIQRELLPAAAPRVEGYELCGTNTPALAVGGDYFDYISNDDGTLALCIGDVSGKGLPASLLMANLQASLRGQSGAQRSPAECLSRVNRLLHDSTSAEKFATVFYGILDPQTHRFRYCNAGHETPLVIRAAGGCTELSAGGPALGILDSFRFEEGEVDLFPGDLLVMYSDGITEAMSPSHELFGRERLADLLQSGRHLPAAELTSKVVQAVRRHEQGAPQSDDITLVALRRLDVPK